MAKIDNRSADAPGQGGGQRTKDRLLLLLKTRGPQTTKALAAALGISVPAVRTHLQSLAGSVQAEITAAGVGRPAQRWRLTDRAQSLFPDTHSELTVRILDSVETALGSRALEAVIQHRYQETASSYRAALAGRKTLVGRLKKLAEVRCEEGYMAAVEKTADGWLLVENHCPICAAAAACRGFCRNELELFRSVLGEGVHVERVEYLLEGARRCAYEITRVSPAAPGGEQQG